MSYINGADHAYTLRSDPSVGPNTDEVVLYVRDNHGERGVHVWINKADAIALATQLLNAAT